MLFGTVQIQRTSAKSHTQNIIAMQFQQDVQFARIGPSLQRHKKAGRGHDLGSNASGHDHGSCIQLSRRFKLCGSCLLEIKYKKTDKNPNETKLI